MSLGEKITCSTKVKKGKFSKRPQEGTRNSKEGGKWVKMSGWGCLTQTQGVIKLNVTLFVSEKGFRKLSAAEKVIG